MPHRRHTITVASSTLFFVCLVLHAQAGLYSQASIPCNDAEAYKVYESLPARLDPDGSARSTPPHPGSNRQHRLLPQGSP